MSTDLPTLPDDPLTALVRLLVVVGGAPLFLLLPALWIAWAASWVHGARSAGRAGRAVSAFAARATATTVGAVWALLLTQAAAIGAVFLVFRNVDLIVALWAGGQVMDWQARVLYLVSGVTPSAGPATLLAVGVTIVWNWSTVAGKRTMVDVTEVPIELLRMAMALAAFGAVGLGAVGLLFLVAFAFDGALIDDCIQLVLGGACCVVGVEAISAAQAQAERTSAILRQHSHP